MSDEPDPDPTETPDGESDAAARPEAGGSGPRRRMASALGEVRREGKKAALIYAVVDAVLLFLAVNVLLAVLRPAELPAQLAVPAAVTEPIAQAVGRSIPRVTLPGSAVVAAVVGLVAFVGEYGYRVRRPLVEQFEAANPGVAEALRTARDAVEDGADTRMAARLYEDVLDRLRGSSGVALVDTRRLLVTLVVVVALSLATVQVAVVDLDLLGGDGPTNDGSPSDRPSEYEGLEDGDAVLGESEDVQAGDENLTAEIESTGGDEEIDSSEQFPSTSDGGPGSGSGAVDSQQAGYAAPEDVEDAELIREYNLRIRDQDDSDTDP
ncbi:hypothetical protein KTS37_16845 [Halomicroarcula salina]|uniref:Uncharacterized protein n=2 Tax=Haloarcula salina TaxID=1429914 RepID=A0AA41G4G0_9EURY|nr:hypothetical protein [Haloarcula salina]MBV0903454.1 hypothetical protein [Haloarcula salina]